MFTPIQDEILLLIQDIQIGLNTMIIEQQDVHNPCLYNEYTGGINQLKWAQERIAITSINIDEHIEYIMKNAADGNYSAKMKLIEDENLLLKEKLDIYEDEIKAIKNNLNKENKARVKDIELEEG